MAATTALYTPTPPPPLSSSKSPFLSNPRRFNLSFSTAQQNVNSPTITRTSMFLLSVSSTDSPTPIVEDDQQNSDPLPPFTGCQACGKAEIENGCNGEGRIQGGIATVPGFGWWPIKAYRPCPGYVASGGRYRRIGQSMDEVVSGGSSKKVKGPKKSKK